MRKRNGRDVRRRARPDALVSEKTDVVVVGSGNAGLCAALAALQGGADVLIVEKADEAMAGGNSKYTLGATRFAYEGTRRPPAPPGRPGRPAAGLGGLRLLYGGTLRRTTCSASTRAARSRRSNAFSSTNRST